VSHVCFRSLRYRILTPRSSLTGRLARLISSRFCSDCSDPSVILNSFHFFSTPSLFELTWWEATLSSRLSMSTTSSRRTAVRRKLGRKSRLSKRHCPSLLHLPLLPSSSRLPLARTPSLPRRSLQCHEWTRLGKVTALRSLALGGFCCPTTKPSQCK
jgi:hypothetical protein